MCVCVCVLCVHLSFISSPLSSLLSPLSSLSLYSLDAHAYYANEPVKSFMVAGDPLRKVSSRVAMRASSEYTAGFRTRGRSGGRAEAEAYIATSATMMHVKSTRISFLRNRSCILSPLSLSYHEDHDSLEDEKPPYVSSESCFRTEAWRFRE
jgi:hypothetical protein